MAADEGERKLAAILAADVAGYSRLMADDDRATIRTLTDYREVFSEHVATHKGRIVDTAGDSVLAMFDSVVEAVEAAVEIQRTLSTRNVPLPDHRRMHFRIGVNLGDIIVREDGTAYGDGVNVAARLEGLAAAGGIMVSGSAHEQVEGRLDVGLADAGEHEVKNIPKPVRAYRVAMGDEIIANAAPTHVWRWALVVAVATSIVIAGVWALRISSGDETKNSPTAVARVLSLPQGPLLIVFPFEEIGGEEKQSYFGDGLALDITTALTGFSDFRVLAPDTAAGYRDANAESRALFNELGVDYVLKGVIQRSGDSIRVTLQLIDSETEMSIWAQKFDEDLTSQSLFAIQDQVTQAVIREVAQSDAAIQQAERRRARLVPAPDLDAYDCVLLAEHAIDLIEPKTHAVARDCLEKAVAAHPGYARAWSNLSFIYNDEHRLGYNPRPDPLVRAAEAARKAIAIDPENADAHMTIAYVHYSNRDAEATLSAANKSLQLAPDDAENLAFAADLLSQMGDYEYANQLFDKAITINPSYPEWYNWTPFRKAFAEGDWDTAIRYMTKAELGAPDFYWHPAALAACLALQGRIDEAKVKLARALELKPDFATTARDELAYFNFGPETATVANSGIRGLALAGLDVSGEPIFPDAPPVTH
jgi:class 3 adenylate cyclase/TolB-like protein